MQRACLVDVSCTLGLQSYCATHVCLIAAGYQQGHGGGQRRDEPYSRGQATRDPYAQDSYSRPAHSHRGGYQAPADPYGPPPGYGPRSRDPYGAPSRDPYAPPSRDPYGPPARAPYQPPGTYQASYGAHPSHAPPPWQAQQAPSARRPDSNNPYTVLQRDPRQR